MRPAGTQAPIVDGAMLDDVSPPPPSASPAAETSATGGSRLSGSIDWLRGRADTSLGRLALLWFRRYFEASRNSGAAASAYIALSVLPDGARHRRVLQPGAR